MVIVTAAWVLLIGIYYAVPAGRESAVYDVVRLVVGLAFVGLVITWQTSHIVKSEVPELRAAQALGVILPLFLVLFASIYLSLYDTSRISFSQPLDHTERAVLHHNRVFHRRLRRHHPADRQRADPG